ncbi:MAG TPA: S16 family serine protease [Acidimicrobiales bacterium]|nr:S16 family serine protease [Acidimicrobiales bacterium]
MTDLDTTPTGHDPAFVPPPPGPGAPGRKRRRWPIVLGVLVAIVGGGVWGLSRWNVNYYAITPGDATPVAPLITVPPAFNHPFSGSVLLTDVFVTQLNALTFLQERYFSSDAEVISTSDLLGPSTPPDQFFAQGYLEMTQAQQAATAAALNTLGYTVRADNAGALIYGIQPNSPAADSLKVAEVVVGVDYTLTPTACALVHALNGLHPGSTAVLKVEKSYINDSGVFVPGPVVQQKVTLGTPPKGLVETGCGRSTVPTAFLGIEPQTQYAWNFPVTVHVHTAGIGGPSAGLAMTLGIIDKLSGGHLTGGHIVAATGTIDAAGNVGDVGGVAEKTIAVERAGATVFFVPPQELAAARSKATAGLHVYAVSTLDQALRILKRLGGTVTTSHLLPQAAP